MLPLIFNLLAMLLIGLAFLHHPGSKCRGEALFSAAGMLGKRSGDLQGRLLIPPLQFVQAVIFVVLVTGPCAYAELDSKPGLSDFLVCASNYCEILPT